MIKDINQIYNDKLVRLSVLFIALSGFLYSFFIPITVGSSSTSLLTMVFLLVLFIVFSFNLLSILKNNETDAVKWLYISLVYTAILHISVLLGFYLSGQADKFLWVVDSHNLHLPGAINISNYIQGKEVLRTLQDSFDKIYLTHVITGVFFRFFGVNPLVSGLSLVMMKLLTIVVMFRLGKVMFNLKVASIGVLIYAFMPNILYYTTVFYKEAVVQFLIATLLLSGFNLFVKKNNLLLHGGILLVFLGFIANERFYLFPIFLFVCIVFVFMNFRKLNRYLLLGILMLSGIGIYMFMMLYTPWFLTQGWGFKNIHTLFSVLADYRNMYMSYSDVTSINTQIPYFIAVVKILFTPYFTFNKFNLFDNYSYILIWSSFLNQAIIGLALYGMWKSLKTKFKEHCFIITPFFLFILLFAYIAPFAGRIRNSFYPIISIYAAYGLSKVIGRFFMRKDNQIISKCRLF
jgi:hypothetical protein